MMISFKTNFIGSGSLDYDNLLLNINIDRGILKLKMLQLCNLKFKWHKFSYFEQKRFKYLNITLR
jgi:hypothetical protein